MNKIAVCKDNIKDIKLKHKKIVSSFLKQKTILEKVSIKERYLNKKCKSCRNKINIWMKRLLNYKIKLVKEMLRIKRINGT